MRWTPVRFGRVYGWCAAITALLTGAAYAARRDGAPARRVSPLSRQRRTHASRDPQPPPRRLSGTGDGLRGLDGFSDDASSHALHAGHVALARRAWTTPWPSARSPVSATPRRRSSRRPNDRPVMDCDTTGIEPDFALVKFKKLAGGGYFKIVNQSSKRRCAARLRREQIAAIERTPKAPARWTRPRT